MSVDAKKHAERVPDEGLLLPGLDGTNPLGFLAALGTLRLAQECWPTHCIHMSWMPCRGGWSPIISLQTSIDQIVDAIVARLGLGEYDEVKHPFLSIGNNLYIEPAKFGNIARKLSIIASQSDRRSIDFIAAFGCECIQHIKQPRIEPTDLHFIFGSGHQNYLDTARKLLCRVTSSHLHEALVGPWCNRDERLSFRWAPVDAREHAYRWAAPGGEAATTTWGANLLAFEGSSMLSTVPHDKHLHTIGFCRQEQQLSLTWPIWSVPANVATIQSILSLSETQEDLPNRDNLKARGVQGVYRSAKIKLGDSKNYKWAFTPAQRIA